MVTETDWPVQTKQLKAQSVTGNEVEQTLHMNAFHYMKSLTVVFSFAKYEPLNPHKERARCKEAAILRHRRSTVAQNVDRLEVFVILS